MTRNRSSALRMVAVWIALLALVVACNGAAPEDPGVAEPEDGIEPVEEVDEDPGVAEPEDGIEPVEEVDEVRIVMVVPLSGLFARQGDLKRKGAQFAVDEINEQGGIEALGGAQLVLDVHDAGESVETAVSATDRALSGDLPAGGIGAWLSSFTLGVTEVAERRGVPWLTLSFADAITERGFEYVYQTSAVSSAQAREGLQMLLELAEQSGQPMEDIALVGDNTAAIEAFFNAIRDGLADEFELEIVAEEVWTPPLADPVPVAQSVRAAAPDAILYGATVFSDAVQILRANEEFGIDAPYFASGAWLLTPEYVEGVGLEQIEGVMSIVGSHPLAGHEEIVERFTEHSGEPFMIQDSMSSYYHVWIFKEAVELAGSADPQAVNQALKEMDLTEGPAAETSPAQRIQFEENGRLADARPVIVQWQDGVPVSVFPPDIAETEPRGF